MGNVAKYDRIGIGYSKHRRADSRIADEIVNLLARKPGDVIADIGAGSGTYSRALADRGFHVYAVEPSGVMRDQAEQHSGVEWFDGTAEAIPLSDSSVAGITAILSLHHFNSLSQAAAEMVRVSSGPIVILTYDPRLAEEFWLSDYFPEIFEDGYLRFPPLSEVADVFVSKGMSSERRPFTLPRDLQDYFLAAGWCRPRIYLDPAVRGCMSAFALWDRNLVEVRIERLRSDIASGAWEQRYGSICDWKEFDGGYRLLCFDQRG